MYVKKKKRKKETIFELGTDFPNQKRKSVRKIDFGEIVKEGYTMEGESIMED